MDRGPEGDALFLDQIIELIELVREDLNGIDQAQFLTDRTKGDATALRLGAIGESSRRLSDDLRARHPGIEWRKMYALRNIVAHQYQQLNYRIIWRVASTALSDLYSACRQELDDLDG